MSTLAELLLALIVAATGIDRAPDAILTSIAEQRAVEIQTAFNHDLMRPGTAEVLAWNEGYASPVERAVEQWEGSPPHWSILTDPSLTRIGCAVAGQTTWYFVCVLAGPLSKPVIRTPTPAPPAPTPAPAVPTATAAPTPASTPIPAPIMLPDTAYAEADAEQTE